MLKNELITVTLESEKGDSSIEFQLNEEELKGFLTGKIFEALIDNLCTVSFKK